MSDRTTATVPSNADDETLNNFIPDLCQTNAVLFTLLLTQIFAFFVSIILSSSSLIDWESLGILSLYCQAIALTCAATTCKFKARISGWSSRHIAIAFVTLSSSITLVYGFVISRFILMTQEIDLGLFLIKSVLMAAILSALVLRYFFLQHQWRLHKQAELQARLEALQSRIRPHFLFNSMNSIAGLITIDPIKAEDAILDLCQLFRATLSNQSMMTPLTEELELCRRYLNIESLRLGPRLKTEWDVDAEVSSLKIPALSLQPLFENAVYHGIQPSVEGGKISFKAYRQKQYAYILISNPLPKNTQERSHQGNQIALSNIKSRIQAIYGERAVIKTSIADNIFNVTLRLPWEHLND